MLLVFALILWLHRLLLIGINHLNLQFLFCVNEFTNTHTCDDWEISNYNNEIENYRRDLEDYQRELQDYVDQANRFANDAYRYAECEINSIN